MAAPYLCPIWRPPFHVSIRSADLRSIGPLTPLPGAQYTWMIQRWAKRKTSSTGCAAANGLGQRAATAAGFHRTRERHESRGLAGAEKPADNHTTNFLRGYGTLSGCAGVTRAGGSKR